MKPRLKTAIKPIFFPMGICRPHRTGIGRRMTMQSMARSVDEGILVNFFLSPQLPGNSVYHCFSGGVQKKAPAKTTPIQNAVQMPMVM